MKTYKAPIIRMVELDDEECIIQTSGLGYIQEQPTNDNENNQFSKMLNIVNMGDDEELTWE